jgi:indole-3-glycerol phosphate synthase
VAVAESGMRGPEDIERVATLGYGAALVGTALMNSGDAAATVRSMLDAGRRVASVAG